LWSGYQGYKAGGWEGAFTAAFITAVTGGIMSGVSSMLSSSLMSFSLLGTSAPSWLVVPQAIGNVAINAGIKGMAMDAIGQIMFTGKLNMRFALTAGAIAGFSAISGITTNLIAEQTLMQLPKIWRYPALAAFSTGLGLAGNCAFWHSDYKKGTLQSLGNKISNIFNPNYWIEQGCQQGVVGLYDIGHAIIGGGFAGIFRGMGHSPQVATLLAGAYEFLWLETTVESYARWEYGDLFSDLYGAWSYTGGVSFSPRNLSH